uniref:Myb-like protein X n=1 Tax=Davidia involucrata TaxID=16924 RepID=A0A5B6ZHZ2_DAVIN
MLRQSPSRNQRSKGIKVKHVLQICLLLAVCFWLIYQVKHSHDKKKEFDENDVKISLMQSGNEILKFGRKDLHPQMEETTTKNEKHDEEEAEEEETGGEEETKHEEEEQEEDSKTEEKEDEGRGGGGDDELDEHDQEKSNMEVDREEEFIDEEKESEEGDEKESEEKDAEDKEGQIENESSLEDHDHDGGGRNDHEAREENYKGDDASSAVTHDTQTISTETEKGSSENLNENTEMNIVEQENRINTTEEIKVGQNTTGLEVGDSNMAKNGIPLNTTANEEKVLEIVSSKSEDSSVLNSRETTEANNQPEVSNNSMEVSTETQDLSLQNGRETISDPTQAENATVGETTSGEDSSLQTIALEQANNSNIASVNNQSDFNLTISLNNENAEATTGESSNSSTNLESVVSEKVTRSNASAEAEDNTGSSTTEENIDATQNEKSETSNERDGTNESLDSSTTENLDEIQHDPIDSSDSSIPLEEKEVRIDLDTLPEIRTEGSNNEDAAAE